MVLMMGTRAHKGWGRRTTFYPQREREEDNPPNVFVFGGIFPGRRNFRGSFQKGDWRSKSLGPGLGQWGMQSVADQ